MHKTPYLLIDKARLKERYLHFSQFGKVFYPIKANDHPVVVGLVKELGVSFEVDFLQHIELLSQLDVNMRDILFSLPVKPTHDIQGALKHGVNTFVIDSKSELHKIDKLHSGSALSFIVRLSTNDLISSPPNHAKWGADMQTIRMLVDEIEGLKHNFLGLSFYLPKGFFSNENFSKVLLNIKANFPKGACKVIDIGGGLDSSQSKTFQELVASLKTELGLLEVYIEPGRNLLNPCIDIVTQVTDVVQRGKVPWIYLDTGIYSGLLDHIIVNRRFEINIFRPTGKTAGEHEFTYFVSGQTSDTLDTLGTYTFPCPINPGDYLVIKEAGAYTNVFNTGFGKKSYMAVIL